LDAGQGGTTPAVAVIEVVGGLDKWIGKDDMVHVGHLLCGKSSGQLLGQLRAQCANLNAKNGSLEESNTNETIGRDGMAATVRTDVRAAVSLYRDHGWIGDATGDWHTWTFHLVRDSGLTHGWKVCSASLSDPFK